MRSTVLRFRALVVVLAALALVAVFAPGASAALKVDQQILGRESAAANASGYFQMLDSAVVNDGSGAALYTASTYDGRRQERTTTLEVLDHDGFSWAAAGVRTTLVGDGITGGSVASDGTAAVLFRVGAATRLLVRRSGAAAWSKPMDVPGAATAPAAVRALPDGSVVVVTSGNADPAAPVPVTVHVRAESGAWAPVVQPFGATGTGLNRLESSPSGQLVLHVGSSDTVNRTVTRIDGAWTNPVEAPGYGEMAIGDDGTTAMVISDGYWEDQNCAIGGREQVYGAPRVWLQVQPPRGAWSARTYLHNGDDGDEAAVHALAVSPTGRVHIAWHLWLGHIRFSPTCNMREEDSPLEWRVEEWNAGGVVRSLGRPRDLGRHDSASMAVDREGRVALLTSFSSGGDPSAMDLHAHTATGWASSSAGPKAFPASVRMSENGRVLALWSVPHGSDQPALAGASTAMLGTDVCELPARGRATRARTDDVQVGDAHALSLDGCGFTDLGGGRYKGSKFLLAGLEVRADGAGAILDKRAGTVRFSKRVVFLASRRVGTTGDVWKKVTLLNRTGGLTLDLRRDSIELESDKPTMFSALRRGKAITWKPDYEQSKVIIPVDLPQELAAAYDPRLGKYGRAAGSLAGWDLVASVGEEGLKVESGATLSLGPKFGIEVAGVPVVRGVGVQWDIDAEKVTLLAQLGVKWAGMRGLDVAGTWAKLPDGRYGLTSVDLSAGAEVPIGASGLFLQELRGGVEPANPYALKAGVTIAPKKAILAKFFTLKGDVKISTNATVAGSDLTFTGGAFLPIFSGDTPITSGTFRVTGKGVVGVSGKTRLSVPTVGSISSSASGSIDAWTRQFTLTGRGTVQPADGASELKGMLDVLMTDEGVMACVQRGHRGSVGWGGTWKSALAWEARPCGFLSPTVRSRVRGADAKRAARAAEPTVVDVPAGQPSYFVELAGSGTGPGSAPSGTFVGPNGERTDPPNSTGVSMNAVGVVIPDHVNGRTLAVLSAPAAGTWRFEPTEVSIGATGVRTAEPAPAVKVTATARVQGERLVVKWKASGSAGRSLVLIERGRGVMRELGELKAASGTIRAPLRRGGDRRTIDLVVRENGLAVSVTKVASYKAPADKPLRAIAFSALYNRGTPAFVQAKPVPRVPDAAAYVITTQVFVAGRWRPKMVADFDDGAITKYPGFVHQTVPQNATQVRVWLQAQLEDGRTTPLGAPRLLKRPPIIKR